MPPESCLSNSWRPGIVMPSQSQCVAFANVERSGDHGPWTERKSQRRETAADDVRFDTCAERLAPVRCADSLGRQSLILLSAFLIKSLSHDTDHPAEAEAVGKHAEARRPERLAQRHLYLAAVGQRGEGAVGLGFRRHGQREREAGEARTFLASVGSHECGSADAESGVHDFVFKARRQHPGRRRFRAFLVVHEHIHLRAERRAVEFQRLFAAAAEEYVGLDECFSHWCFGVVGCAGLFVLGKASESLDGKLTNDEERAQDVRPGTRRLPRSSLFGPASCSEIDDSSLKNPPANSLRSRNNRRPASADSNRPRLTRMRTHKNIRVIRGQNFRCLASASRSCARCALAAERRTHLPPLEAKMERAK